MTRVITVSSDLATEPQSNGGCGSYSIISCAACGRRAVDEELGEAQCHVDAARDAGRGDDPALEVLDHPLGRGRAPWAANSR